MTQLFGPAPNQAPRNIDLGKLAYQDSAIGTGPIGYVQGAGAAVTQITSRTTGVTINALSGQITLVSAAGSPEDTAWTAMTVANSQVAATDVILITQSAGANIYCHWITAVAAGSFVFNFATTGGTATDSPTFNFVIIKGAAS